MGVLKMIFLICSSGETDMPVVDQHLHLETTGLHFSPLVVVVASILFSPVILEQDNSKPNSNVSVVNRDSKLKSHHLLLLSNNSCQSYYSFWFHCFLLSFRNHHLPIIRSIFLQYTILKGLLQHSKFHSM